MIKASPNKAARLLFGVYLKRLLRKNFSHFYLTNECPGICNTVPLIITPNHISWWDGFFIDFVNAKIFKRSLHIMMLEEQLKHFWFFRYLGAYSIKQGNPKSIIETAGYSAEVTNNPANLNVIYPQGEIEPFEKGSVSVKKGLSYFIKNVSGTAIVLPVLFKIQYEEEKKPAVYCHFTDAVSVSKVMTDYSSYIKTFEDGLCQLGRAAHEKIKKHDLFKAGL